MLTVNTVILLSVIFCQVQGTNDGLEVAFNCSVYTFHMRSKISWEESKNLCEQNGSKLVSMERLRAELNFLETQSEALKVNTIEYYIGLRKNGQKWMWVSDNSTLEETERGRFPWASCEPAENGNCVKMWRLKRSPWTYVFDDTKCRLYSLYVGYICERTSTALKCGSNDARDKTAERIELEIQNTSLLNPAQDAHRRQTGVSHENDEEGCEEETVQPGGMECGYTTLHHLSRTPGDCLYTSLTSCDPANSGGGTSNDSPIYFNQVPPYQYANG